MANSASAVVTTDYGYDTSCLDGLRTGRFASGLQLVGEACYRRLTTPAGQLALIGGGEDEANYGLDLGDLIGSVSAPNTVAALPGQIESELLKDERISSVEADVTSVTNGAVTSWTISISAETTTGGSFALVIGVTGVTVALLGLTVS